MSAIAIQTRTVALACTLFCLHATHAQQGTPAAPLSGTKLVLLGTGTPPADPDRSGPATRWLSTTLHTCRFWRGRGTASKIRDGRCGIDALDPVKLRVVFLRTCIPTTPWVIRT